MVKVDNRGVMRRRVMDALDYIDKAQGQIELVAQGISRGDSTIVGAVDQVYNLQSVKVWLLGMRESLDVNQDRR